MLPTIVRPIIKYACIIWGTITQENIIELEMTQRRAALFVTCATIEPSVV